MLLRDTLWRRTAAEIAANTGPTIVALCAVAEFGLNAHDQLTLAKYRRRMKYGGFVTTCCHKSRGLLPMISTKSFKRFAMRPKIQSQCCKGNLIWISTKNTIEWFSNMTLTAA